MPRNAQSDKTNLASQASAKKEIQLVSYVTTRRTRSLLHYYALLYLFSLCQDSTARQDVEDALGETIPRIFHSTTSVLFSVSGTGVQLCQQLHIAHTCLLWCPIDKQTLQPLKAACYVQAFSLQSLSERKSYSFLPLTVSNNCNSWALLDPGPSRRR